MQKEIKLYTWAHCPYCNGAKALLTERGLHYSDIDVYHQPELKEELEKKTGQRTVPFIFIEDTFIGGFTELKEMDQHGKLKTLV